jgi:hypothetical protein
MREKGAYKELNVLARSALQAAGWLIEKQSWQAS